MGVTEAARWLAVAVVVATVTAKAVASAVGVDPLVESVFVLEGVTLVWFAWKPMSALPFLAWLVVAIGGAVHALLWLPANCSCMGDIAIGWRGELALALLLAWACAEVLLAKRVASQCRK